MNPVTYGITADVECSVILDVSVDMNPCPEIHGCTGHYRLPLLLTLHPHIRYDERKGRTVASRIKEVVVKNILRRTALARK